MRTRLSSEGEGKATGQARSRASNWDGARLGEPRYGAVRGGDPDSAISAAMGFVRQSWIPSSNGPVGSHDVGRAFIERKRSICTFRVKLKLNPVRHIVAGKRVVPVDDSIVRGTGASDVHFGISCAPTIAPCYCGVGTADGSDPAIVASATRATRAGTRRGLFSSTHLCGTTGGGPPPNAGCRGSPVSQDRHSEVELLDHCPSASRHALVTEGYGPS